ncbi:MAG: patatin-like phospholipase family protein [Actinomycetes bacterium]
MTQAIQHNSDQHSSQTALVLGGGGSAGNAWLIGVVAGLVDAGIDVTQADLVVGTSAGATAAAQITGAAPAELLADILGSAFEQGTAAVLSSSERPRTAPPTDHLQRTSRIIAAADDASDMRRRMGALALEMNTGSDAGARWRATVAARLPNEHWPDRAMLITAVDAQTGDAVTFDRHSGVDLVDAVAASCASGFAYRIGEHSYIDGGYRSNADNADLAAGHARVLVLSPLGGRSRTPVEWGLHLATQVDGLRAGGSRVETLFPDTASLTAFGENMMDLSTRPPAAQAGENQGKVVAERLAKFWI